MNAEEMHRRIVQLERTVSQQQKIIDAAFSRIVTLEGTSTGLVIGCHVIGGTVDAYAPEYRLSERLRDQITMIEGMPYEAGRTQLLKTLQNLIRKEPPDPPTLGVIEGGKTD